MNIFGIGLPEMVVIFVLALLIFGPKKLPEIGRSLGKTLKSFQEASKEFEAEIKKGAVAIDPPQSSTPSNPTQPILLSSTTPIVQITETQTSNGLVPESAEPMVTVESEIGSTVERELESTVKTASTDD